MSSTFDSLAKLCVKIVWNLWFCGKRSGRSNFGQHAEVWRFDASALRLVKNSIWRREHHRTRSSTIVCCSACWEAHNTLRDWREDLYTSNTACERNGAWKVLLRGAIIVFYDDGYFPQINSQTCKCLQKTTHPSRLFLGSLGNSVSRVLRKKGFHPSNTLNAMFGV